LEHISARLQDRNRLELAARPYRAPRLVTDAPERLALPPSTAGKAKTDVSGGEFQGKRQRLAALQFELAHAAHVAPRIARLDPIAAARQHQFGSRPAGGDDDGFGAVELLDA